jgi:hypothetical protein
MIPLKKQSELKIETDRNYHERGTTELQHNRAKNNVMMMCVSVVVVI